MVDATQSQDEITIKFNASVKKKKRINIMYAKKIKLGILAHMLVSVEKIVRLINILKDALSQKV